MRNMFMEEIKREQRRISRLTNLTEENWEPKEQGVLLLQQKKCNTYCYERFSRKGQKKGKHYLGTMQSEAAKEYVRNRFLKEKHHRLAEDKALLDQVEKCYLDYSFDAVMSALPGSCRQVAFEDFNNIRYEELKRWAAEDYPVNPMPFPEQEIYTGMGLRVRSKGECIHANIYDSRGIPFRFDSEMIFQNDYGDKRIFYPDFVIRCFDGSLIIIEHLGRLFDKRYALNFGEKCYWYLHSGFILGKNFFVTSDDAYGGTDSRPIAEVAKAVERLFYGF